MTRIKTALTALAIFVPLLGMGLWIGQLEYQIASGTEVEIEITGFDPRDLLAGHYLSYQLELGPVEPCSSDSASLHKTVCVCLNTANGKAKSTWSGECSEMKGCNLFLKGRCQWGSFRSSIDRYYFPEKYSRSLRTVPPKSSIKAVIGSNGIGWTRELLVEGRPLQDFIQAPVK